MSKNKKNFFNQFFIETKKMFRSKFMLIMLGLILILSIVLPILSNTNNQNNQNDYTRWNDDIIINGQTISALNPMYWQIKDLDQNLSLLKENSKSEKDDTVQEYFEYMLEKLVSISKDINTNDYNDYRIGLIFQYEQDIREKFLLEHPEITEEDIYSTVYGIRDTGALIKSDVQVQEQNKTELTEAERIEKLEELDKNIEQVENIVLQNDYFAYYSYMINQQNEQFQNNLKNIEQLEKDIIEKPDFEETYNSQIEEYKQSNKNITDIEIPAYEYAIENDIRPDESDWRYQALNDKKQLQYNIQNYSIMTQAEFEKNSWYKEQYKSYNEYEEAMEKKRDEYTENLLKADNSLITKRPDMKYIENGTRKKVIGFLWFSLIVAAFGALIGGGIIAREFQTGTIRLLLIRPRKRIKIVLSKLFSLLTVCFVAYIVSVLLNIVINGILFGFNDLAYPNYTISSGENGISFFMYYMPKFLVSGLAILFICSVAYFMSILTKNTAVSVAVPMVIFISSLILMQFAMNSNKLTWLSYTPFAYINMSLYFINNLNNYINYYIDSFSYNAFTPNLALGIPMMIGLSLIFIVLGTIIFNKRDVTS